jgi:hypothetical protein
MNADAPRVDDSIIRILPLPGTSDFVARLVTSAFIGVHLRFQFFCRNFLAPAPVRTLFATSAQLRFGSAGTI